MARCLIHDWYGEDKSLGTIEEYTERHLDGDDYGKGMLEATSKTADNVVGAMGRLLSFLADRGVLSPQDIVEIVEDFQAYKNIRFGENK